MKVQRPNILDNVALDMFIIRAVGLLAQRFFNLNTDIVGLVDEWALGFVDELDYRKEAQNSQIFMKSISSTPLAGLVFAPEVVSSASNQRVLTTRWVEGERLEKSDNKDIAALCSLAMNAYLTMMLETGVLHSDPHPGNLFRTPEGIHIT